LFCLRTSVLKCAVALEVCEQVMPRRLELVADESQTEQEHPKIVFAVYGFSSRLRLLAARVDGLRAERETELDVTLDTPE